MFYKYINFFSINLLPVTKKLCYKVTPPLEFPNFLITFFHRRVIFFVLRRRSGKFCNIG